MFPRRLSNAAMHAPHPASSAVIAARISSIWAYRFVRGTSVEAGHGDHDVADVVAAASINAAPATRSSRSRQASPTIRHGIPLGLSAKRPVARRDCVARVAQATAWAATHALFWRAKIRFPDGLLVRRHGAGAAPLALAVSQAGATQHRLRTADHRCISSQRA